MMTNEMLRWLLLLTALLYYGAFACSILEKKHRLPKGLPYGLLGAAVLGNLTAIVNNYLYNGHVPFVSIFQVLIVLGLCFVPIYLYLTYLCKCRGYFPVFAFASAIVLTGTVFMDTNPSSNYPPALQSPFFIPHVLVYMISYSLGAVAFALVILSFANELRLHKYWNAFEYPSHTASVLFTPSSTYTNCHGSPYG